MFGRQRNDLAGHYSKDGHNLDAQARGRATAGATSQRKAAAPKDGRMAC